MLLKYKLSEIREKKKLWDGGLKIYIIWLENWWLYIVVPHPEKMFCIRSEDSFVELGQSIKSSLIY